MKKVLGLMLALVVSASLFAVDVGNGLAVTGGVYAGVYFEGAGGDLIKDTDEGHAYARARYDDDYDGMRAQVRFTYTQGNVGTTFRFRWTANADDKVTVTDAYGWANLLGGKIELSAGKLDNSKWGSGKLPVNYTDTTYDNEPGVKLDFKVIDGLSFGVALFKFPIGVEKGKGNLPIDYWFNNTVVGVRYTKAGLIDASLAAKFDSYKNPDWFGEKEGGAWDYSSLDSRGVDATDPHKQHTYFDMSGGATYLGISGVNVGVDFRFASAKGDKDYLFTGDDSLFKIALGASYSSGPIGVTFKVGYENVNYKSLEDGDKTNANDYSIPVRFDASYKVSDTVSAVGLAFEADFKGKSGKDPADKDIETDTVGNNVLIKPYLSISFGNGASFTIYDKIIFETDIKMKGDDTPKGKSTNKVQLNFAWEF